MFEKRVRTDYKGRKDIVFSVNITEYCGKFFKSFHWGDHWKQIEKNVLRELGLRFVDYSNCDKVYRMVYEKAAKIDWLYSLTLGSYEYELTTNNERIFGIEYEQGYELHIHNEIGYKCSLNFYRNIPYGLAKLNVNELREIDNSAFEIDNDFTKEKWEEQMRYQEEKDKKLKWKNAPIKWDDNKGLWIWIGYNPSEGAKNWLAEITGLDDIYVFKRRFIHPERVGDEAFVNLHSGIYQFNSTKRSKFNGFWKIRGKTVSSMTKEEVKEYFT